MDKIKNMIKDKIMYIIVGIIIVILLFLLIINYHKLLPLEEASITNYSNKMMRYMDVLEKENLDYYVCYTVTYYKNEYNKNSVSVNEIVNFINKHFNKKVTKKEIESLGVTPYMIEKYITYNDGEKKYTITTDELSYADIAKIKVVNYDIEKIKKINKKIYEITYNKYVIDNPYDILNYYVDKKKEDEAEIVNNYLRGKASRKDIDKYITNKIGKKKDTIKVKYVIDDGNILIDTNFNN